MKKVITVVSLMVFASVAQASIYVNWTTSGGYAWDGFLADGLVPEGSGQSVLFQLIWTPSGTASTADANNPGYVSGDNILLTNEPRQETGTASDNFFYAMTLDSAYDDQGDDYQTTYGTDGFIFARVFENEAPGVDDYYYQGPVVAAVNADFGATQPPTAQGYNMTQVGEETYSGVDINYIDGMYSAQVVPEPGTIALFALGLGTFAAARRKRKGAIEA